jgi:murein DD-endopeptidase MepM/ murein hydrolase activator NlpD
MKRLLCVVACCFAALATSCAEAQEKKAEKVLAKEFSSPLKDVVWKPNSYTFTEDCTYDLPKRGKVAYGKHLGEDYDTENGTPVLACADGRISLSKDVPGTPQKPGWGGVVVIGHWLTDKVAVYSIYGHLERNKSLKTGDLVRRGQKIGTVAKGGTPENGHWKKTHLHLQFLLDPRDKYRRGMVPAGYDSYLKDEKLVPFDAPWRLLDHLAPSEVLSAKDPVALLLKEEANPKRK